MKNTLKFTKLLMVAFVTTFFSCEQVENFEAEIQQQEVSPEIVAGLANLGFDTETHPVLKTKEGYVVEGDMVLPLKDEEILHPQLIKQRRVPTDVNCSEISSIRVRASLNKRLQAYVKNACNRWNDKNDIALKFVYAGNTTNNYDINIVNNGDSSVFALADFPSGGKPGKVIKLNWRKIEKAAKDLNWTQAEINENLVDAITHELGHTIGLAHSDGLGNPSSASYIPYTPGTGKDKNSIMNLGLTVSSRITSGDTKAVNYIYKDCD